MGGDSLKRHFLLFATVFPRSPSLGLSAMYDIATSRRLVLAKYPTPSPDIPSSHYRFFWHSPGLNPIGPIPCPLSSTSALPPFFNLSRCLGSLYGPLQPTVSCILTPSSSPSTPYVPLPKMKLRALAECAALRAPILPSLPNPTWRGNHHWRPQKHSDNCPSQIAGAYWIIQSGQVSSSILL